MLTKIKIKLKIELNLMQQYFFEKYYILSEKTHTTKTDNTNEIKDSST